ncbi:hypothetical protein JN403_17280 [Pseudomonas sp. 15A4]|uniref:hypothetical protein n=1 Tax=Pseudomonas sp. 15A4 TaxID=2804761 RepID=UPI001966DF89|nr:hypothetical protein [Pseudomonas sp. 15A4]QSB18295.1 hypothetical protein JN403_17280 [Pseudomonas sp. 15A4]
MLVVQADGTEALSLLLLNLVDEERNIQIAVFSGWDGHRYKRLARNDRIRDPLVREVKQAPVDSNNALHPKRLFTHYAAN